TLMVTPGGAMITISTTTSDGPGAGSTLPVAHSAASRSAAPFIGIHIDTGRIAAGEAGPALPSVYCQSQNELSHTCSRPRRPSLAIAARGIRAGISAVQNPPQPTGVAES